MSVTSLHLQRIHAKSLLDVYTVSLLYHCCMIKRKQDAFEASALSLSSATFIHPIHHCNFYTSGLLYTRAANLISLGIQAPFNTFGENRV